MKQLNVVMSGVATYWRDNCVCLLCSDEDSEGN